jgi:hypothetical protein
MNFADLLKWFDPSVVEAHKTAPAIEGYFHAETRERGKLVQRSEGTNVWTLTGREYLTELIGLKAAAPRTTYRDDRISFIGLGSGSQAEEAGVTSLVSPIPYSPGEYLAAVASPPTFPASAASSTKTAIRFIREYGLSEISLGYDVVLTEAGLFTDGNPDDDWALNAPTGIDGAGDRSPMAYKTFEPITKTTQYTLRVIWEVRFK